MKLEGIFIWDQAFDSNEFWSNCFIDAINTELKKWNISKEIGLGIWIITKYTPEKELDLNEIVEVARAVIALRARAITQWELDTSSISELTIEEITNINTFNQKLWELQNKITPWIDNIQEDKYIITLMSRIPNTSYWIFKSENSWNTTFYIAGTKIDSLESWYIVDSNGESISELLEKQKLYCLIQIGANVEIWSGSVDEWFIKKITLKNIQAESIDILLEDIIGIIDWGIFTLKNIDTNQDLLDMSMKDFSGFTDSGKPVDVYFEHWKYLFIYKWFNDQWEVAYIATDDDLNEECYSAKYPIYPIITPNDIYLTMYSPEANLYCLTTINDVLVWTIVAYIDDDENYFIWWNFPEYVTNPKWISQLKFMYYWEDVTWKKQYDTWYVFCWIESDGTPDRYIDKVEIDLLSVNPANLRVI
jgi:hypothetical protein